MPVSFTDISTESPLSNMFTNILPPSSVNLIAFEIRFKIILSILSGSQAIIFSSTLVSKIIFNPFNLT